MTNLVSMVKTLNCKYHMLLQNYPCLPILIPKTIFHAFIITTVVNDLEFIVYTPIQMPFFEALMHAVLFIAKTSVQSDNVTVLFILFCY